MELVLEYVSPPSLFSIILYGYSSNPLLPQQSLCPATFWPATATTTTLPSQQKPTLQSRMKKKRKRNRPKQSSFLLTLQQRHLDGSTSAEGATSPGPRRNEKTIVSAQLFFDTLLEHLAGSSTRITLNFGTLHFLSHFLSKAGDGQAPGASSSASERQRVKLVEEAVSKIATLSLSPVPALAVRAETAEEDPYVHLEMPLHWPSLRELSLRRCGLDNSSLFSWGAPVDGAHEPEGEQRGADDRNAGEDIGGSGAAAAAAVAAALVSLWLFLILTRFLPD